VNKKHLISFLAWSLLFSLTLKDTYIIFFSKIEKVRVIEKAEFEEELTEDGDKVKLFTGTMDGFFCPDWSTKKQDIPLIINDVIPTTSPVNRSRKVALFISLCCLKLDNVNSSLN